MSVLNVNISRFKSATDPRPDGTITLLEWINGIPNSSFLVDQIRASADKHQRDQFKKQLPAITPSGTFTKRNKAGLIIHSGLIAFDIDNIEDSAPDIRAQLATVPNIAYCGLSASGKGLWGLIPISDPAKHEAHFRAIELAFVAMGITIDPSCKDVSRLRFYSYDNEAHINHNAVTFTHIYYDPKIPSRPITNPNRLATGDVILQRAVKLINSAHDGQKYFILNKASFLLGGYIGAGKINEDEAREVLRAAISGREVADIEAAYRTIDIGLKDGQLKPII